MTIKQEYIHPIIQQDLQAIAAEHLPWHQLQGKTVLVTGATGMLARYLVWFLLYLHQTQNIDVKVVALCRTRSKAEALFSEFMGQPSFELLIQDVCQPIAYEGKLDYILHLAGNASPHFINIDPVGILQSNLLGTLNCCEFARTHCTQKIIFASTREVYGKNEAATLLDENSFGSIDPLEDRSCYPESKRGAEALLRAYFNQYGVNFNALRIAHSYGPGMALAGDGRVMADLMNDVVCGRDIVLKSTGEALRAFCYLTDAIRGFFYALFYGESGKAYNLANETEEIAIRDLAELLVSLRPEYNLKVVFDIPEGAQRGYCNYRRVALDTTAIEQLGWEPLIPLKEGLQKTLDYFTKP